jgi:hypothetical protein
MLCPTEKSNGAYDGSSRADEGDRAVDGADELKPDVRHLINLTGADADANDRLLYGSRPACCAGSALPCVRTGCIMGLFCCDPRRKNSIPYFSY